MTGIGQEYKAAEGLTGTSERPAHLPTHWNDGMNLVGRDGRGESVWLAWFLVENLQLFTRRAYFDDGTPLGSSASEECQIDSISQSWAVISGGGDPVHDRQAWKR